MLQKLIKLLISFQRNKFTKHVMQKVKFSAMKLTHELTYNGVRSFDDIIDSYLFVIENLHPILSRLLLIEEIC